MSIQPAYRAPATRLIRYWLGQVGEKIDGPGRYVSATGASVLRGQGDGARVRRSTNATARIRWGIGLGAGGKPTIQRLAGNQQAATDTSSNLASDAVGRGRHGPPRAENGFPEANRRNEQEKIGYEAHDHPYDGMESEHSGAVNPCTVATACYARTNGSVGATSHPPRGPIREFQEGRSSRTRFAFHLRWSSNLA